jgi:hypothetical protein
MSEADKASSPTDRVRLAVELAPLREPLWTQEEAVAFECAREYLSDIIGIYSHELSGQEAPDALSEDRARWLQAEIARLAELRRQLHVKDHDQVAEVRSVYGALWRQLVGA